MTCESGSQKTGVGVRALWAFTLLWVSALMATAAAGERWNVMVVGESGPDSMPLTHPAWRRVDEAISEQLTAAGFSIYDKAALGLALNCDSGACGNRPVADYVRWAREQRGGIDLIVIYSITATERRRPATWQWQVRVPGRAVVVEGEGLADDLENEVNCQRIVPRCADGTSLNRGQAWSKWSA